MGARYGFGTLRPDEADRVAVLVATSFALAPDRVLAWFDVAGRDHVRVLRRGREPVAALLHVPMGQFFGGRSVPLVGIAGVACPPHERGHGTATELMRRTVRELHATGVAASGLYPAVRPLYERAGYAVAAARFETRARIRGLGDGERDGTIVRPFEDRDRAAVLALYRRLASRRQGFLDRGPYVWKRVFERKGEPTVGHVVEERGALTGYVFYVSIPQAESIFLDVLVQDMAASTARARARLLTLLGDLQSLGDEVTFFGPLFDARHATLAQRQYQTRLYEHYMLRIVDVARALEARGYPKGVSLELHLDVEDDVVPDNAGRYRVRIADGTAQVAHGGRGALAIDVRGLAALFSGYASPETLEEMGLASGSRAAFATAQAAFASELPTVADMF
jgi:predicted acetyltransferase